MRKKATPYSKNYATCALCWAELVVTCPEFLSSQVVSEYLKIPSFFFYEENEQVDMGFGLSAITTGREWIFSSRGQLESLDIRHHLNWLTEKIISATDGLKRIQTEENAVIEIRCIWWSRYGDGGPVLLQRQHADLVRLGLPCSFRFYLSPEGRSAVESQMEILDNLVILEDQGLIHK